MTTLTKKDTLQQLRSPLTVSVALDNLEQINDKCDSTERNILEINSNVKLLQNDSCDDSQSTKFLRARFMSLIDSDKIGDNGTANKNFNSSEATSSNDSSQYPVIDELLPNVPPTDND